MCSPVSCRLVASGTISQNYASFSAASRNTQCVCISVATCAYIENVCRHSINTVILDSLIFDGDVYYKETKRTLGPTHPHRFLNPDEVNRVLTLRTGRYNVETIYAESGLYPRTERDIPTGVAQLESKLEALLNSNPESGFVWIGLNVAVSIWKSRTLYFLSDSHSIDATGKYTPDGVARVFSFENVREISKFLLNRSPLDGTDWQYEISRVVSTAITITRDTATDSSDDDVPLSKYIDSGKKTSRPESMKRTYDDAKLNSQVRVVVKDIFKEKQIPTTDNKIQLKRKVGRPPKKVRGRPKTSLLNKKEQHKENDKRYKVNNTRIYNDASSKYNKSNPEINRTTSQTYHQKHPELSVATSKTYREANPDSRIPAKIRKEGILAERTGISLNEIKLYKLKNPSLRATNTHKCSHCGARLFEEEIGKKQWCCGQGRYNVMSFPPLTHSIYGDRQFLQHPRLYNDLFSFCALTVPLGYHQKKGLSFMKIQGRTYHMVFDLNCGGSNNSILYVDDGTARIAEGEKSKLSPVIINSLQTYLEGCNPYVSLYKKLYDEPSENAHIVFETTTRRTHGPVLGDRPTCTEVSAILSCDQSERPRGKFCIWKKGSTEPRFIDENSFMVEPLQYPLLYPEGQPGWHINRTDNAEPPRKLSLLKYTRCLLLSEDRFSKFGPLSETWLIDMYARIEGQRLGYLQHMQKKARAQGGLRMGPIDEVQAAVPNEVFQDETIQGEGNVIPGRVYLPQTFTGGPRYMKVCYMDAMALVSRLGGPTYFLTFTACGQWDEIKLSKNPCSKQEAHICNRVFELKRRELMRDIQSGAFFGKLAYIVWVIEFQMRGLPHAHICFRVADGGPKQNTEIDKIVRADIPERDEAGGRLRKLVLRHMRHGPCGIGYRTDLPCWDNEIQKCSKFFPKPNTPTTYTDDKGFVHYKRNAENKVAVEFRGKMLEVDDRWIVPYNGPLLLKYECHINLEISSARRVIKYLFKYLSKGSPLQRMTVVHENDKHDEIEEYQTKRFVGTTDAAWRVLEYDLTGRDPTVIHLPVHLEGKHNVVFRPGQEQEACEKSTSQLLLYLSRPNIAELDNVTYLDFYEKYIVHASKPKSSLNPIEYSEGGRYLTKRQRGECVARLFYVSPNRGEQYYLRMLLIRYPCRKYKDLYKLGGPACNTFQQAARQVGLADDKKEYFDAIEEAAQFMNASRLRPFFVMLSTIGCPVPEIWVKYKHHLCEDFLEHYPDDEEKAFKLGLIHIDRCLRRHGSCLMQAGLPIVDDNSTELGREKLLYSSSAQNAFVADWEERLSPDQLRVLDHVKSLIDGSSERRLIFLDGPAGTGKTVILNVIAALIRGKNKVVSCVAISGIAAQNLKGGMTAHSLFRLPLSIRDDSIWSITNKTQRAELIREASVVIFDEAPMANKTLVEMLDRCMRDLMQNDVLFGGKIVILAGDFRQIPPVVENARTNSDIVRASIRRSYIWKSVDVFHLETSHRVRDIDDYKEFLLKIGADTIEKHEVGEGNKLEKLVALPQIEYVTAIEKLIEFVFPKEILEKPDECARRAIISTLNNNVHEVNMLVLSMLQGEAVKLYSYDRVAEDDNEVSDLDQALLHEAEGKGIPSHVLDLKIGSLCIVMRNLNFDLGLVNGTKVIIVAISPRLITCRKPDSDELFGIPRISFKFLIFPNSPFEMIRRQFPLKLCYAITIHKSQGQTIDFVGLDLRSDCFTHGQLYVALSRVRSPQNIKLLVSNDRVLDGIPFTKNVVFKELL